VHAACIKAEALVLLVRERVGVQKELPDPGVAKISSSSSSRKISSQALFFLPEGTSWAQVFLLTAPNFSSYLLKMILS
jgi:hypothetical protein